MQTVVEVLEWAAGTHGDRDAYVDGDRRITFEQFGAMSDGIATSLQDRGVKHGDVVTLLMPSSIDFALCYMAAMKVGAITSAVNPRLGPNERASISHRTSPVLTVAPDTLDVGSEWGTVLRVGELSQLYTRGTPRLAVRLHDADTVAIVWTSGTTGLPQGAVYDHRCLKAIHEGMGDLSAPGDRRVVSLPFAHVGYMTRAWDDIANTVTMVLVPDPWTADKQVDLLERERITMATGVPTQWVKMLECPRLAEIDLSLLRLAGIGGAAVAPELVRAVRQRLGCAVMTRYTSTEAGLATGTQLSDSDEVVATTVGVPSSVVEMRLVAPGTDATVGQGNVGEIRLRSPAMFRGYWNDPEGSADALDNDGFLRTGDLGYATPEGNLRIVGRLKEMYIRGGYNVYPAEVEAVLSEHPAIIAAAVVGAPDPIVGEIGVAFLVVDSQHSPPSLSDVRDWCRSQLADYKSPERLVCVEELPVNAMHKVDKTILREQAKEYV